MERKIYDLLMDLVDMMDDEAGETNSQKFIMELKGDGTANAAFFRNGEFRQNFTFHSDKNMSFANAVIKALHSMPEQVGRIGAMDTDGDHFAEEKKPEPPYEYGKDEDVVTYAVCCGISPLNDRIFTKGRVYPVYKFPKQHNRYYYMTDEQEGHSSEPIFFCSYGDKPEEIIESLNRGSTADWAMFQDW